MPDTSTASSDEQPSNMPAMEVAFSVQTPDRSISLRLEQPKNMRKKQVRSDVSTQPLKRIASALQ